MAIAHARTDTTADIASATATLTVTKPTSVAATEVMILNITTEKGSTAAQTITPPAGWTRIGSQVSQVNGAEIVIVDLFWALGNVASTAFTNSATGSGVQQGYVCAAFSGVDNTTPIDVTGTSSAGTGSSSTLTVNSITIVTDQAMHLIASADWLGSTLQTATSFTVSENAHTQAATALLYNTTLKSTGATGTVTLNAASGGTQIIVALPFALRPAAAATTPTLPRITDFFPAFPGNEYIGL